MGIIRAEVPEVCSSGVSKRIIFFCEEDASHAEFRLLFNGYFVNIIMAFKFVLIEQK